MQIHLIIADVCLQKLNYEAVIFRGCMVKVSHSCSTAGRRVLGAEFSVPRAKNLGSLGKKYLRW